MGIPIIRIAGLSASSAPDAMQLFNRRRLTKNSRCHAFSGSVGASNPYFPPTPWNIWIRQVSWSSRVHVKSDVRYASNFTSAAVIGPMAAACAPASRKIDAARPGSSLAMNENRTRSSSCIARCTGANIA